MLRRRRLAALLFAVLVLAGCELDEYGVPVQPITKWDRLATCESQSDWRINTGNGYFGGLQFDQRTWVANGGLDFEPRADLATRSQQIVVAHRLWRARGFAPWPACSRKLGLR